MFLTIRALCSHLLLVVALVATMTERPVAGQEPEAPASGQEVAAPLADLSTPRASIRTFILNMAAPGKGLSGGWQPASVALDLENIPVIGREQAAEQAATALYAIFNRLERVDFSSIPESVAGDRYVYRELPSGQIALLRDPQGRWRFSQSTIESLGSMLVDLSGVAVVEGLQETAFIDSPSVWFRVHLPSWLFKRGFILENFQWMGLLSIILLGFLADRLLRWFLTLGLQRWLAGAGEEYEPDSLRQMAKWVGLTVAGILWMILLGWLSLPEQIALPLRFAAVLFTATSGVLAALRAVDFGAGIFEARARKTPSKFDDILIPLIRKAVKVFVLTVGIIFIADNMAVDITSLLAGLGIGGLAFALAAKDTVENLFGSITILLDRPFQIGDWVNFDGVDGTVEGIGLRSTHVRTFYDSVITVPNSNLIKANIDNYGQRRYRRVRTMLNVTYGTPPERLDAFCEGIRELIRQHPYMRHDYFHVYFNEFGAHSLDILVYAFLSTPDWSTELREKHRFFLDILRLAKRLGIDFAFPTQTLFIEKGVGASSPSKEPYPSFADIESEQGRGRSEADALVAHVHKSGGERFPLPPVTFDVPREPPESRPRGGAAEG